MYFKFQKCGSINCSWFFERYHKWTLFANIDFIKQVNYKMFLHNWIKYSSKVNESILFQHWKNLLLVPHQIRFLVFGGFTRFEVWRIQRTQNQHGVRVFVSLLVFVVSSLVSLLVCEDLIFLNKSSKKLRSAFKITLMLLVITLLFLKGLLWKLRKLFEFFEFLNIAV